MERIQEIKEFLDAKIAAAEAAGCKVTPFFGLRREELYDGAMRVDQFNKKCCLIGAATNLHNDIPYDFFLNDLEVLILEAGCI